MTPPGPKPIVREELGRITPRPPHRLEPKRPIGKHPDRQRLEDHAIGRHNTSPKIDSLDIHEGMTREIERRSYGRFGLDSRVADRDLYSRPYRLFYANFSVHILGTYSRLYSCGYSSNVTIFGRHLLTGLDMLSKHSLLFSRVDHNFRLFEVIKRIGLAIDPSLHCQQPQIFDVLVKLGALSSKIGSSSITLSLVIGILEKALYHHQTEAVSYLAQGNNLDHLATALDQELALNASLRELSNKIAEKEALARNRAEEKQAEQEDEARFYRKQEERRIDAKKAVAKQEVRTEAIRKAESQRILLRLETQRVILHLVEQKLVRLSTGPLTRLIETLVEKGKTISTVAQAIESKDELQLSKAIIAAIQTKKAAIARVLTALLLSGDKAIVTLTAAYHSLPGNAEIPALISQVKRLVVEAILKLTQASQPASISDQIRTKLASRLPILEATRQQMSGAQAAQEAPNIELFLLNVLRGLDLLSKQEITIDQTAAEAVDQLLDEIATRDEGSQVRLYSTAYRLGRASKALARVSASLQVETETLLVNRTNEVDLHRDLVLLDRPETLSLFIAGYQVVKTQLNSSLEELPAHNNPMGRDNNPETFRPTPIQTVIEIGQYAAKVKTVLEAGDSQQVLLLIAETLPQARQAVALTPELKAKIVETVIIAISEAVIPALLKVEATLVASPEPVREAARNLIRRSLQALVEQPVRAESIPAEIATPSASTKVGSVNPIDDVEPKSSPITPTVLQPSDGQPVPSVKPIAKQPKQKSTDEAIDIADLEPKVSESNVASDRVKVEATLVASPEPVREAARNLIRRSLQTLVEQPLRAESITTDIATPSASRRVGSVNPIDDVETKSSPKTPTVFQPSDGQPVTSVKPIANQPEQKPTDKAIDIVDLKPKVSESRVASVRVKAGDTPPVREIVNEKPAEVAVAIPNPTHSQPQLVSTKPKAVEAKKTPMPVVRLADAEEPLIPPSVAHELTSNMPVKPIVTTNKATAAEPLPQTSSLANTVKSTARIEVTATGTAAATASDIGVSVEEQPASSAHENTITKPTDAPKVIPLPTLTQSQPAQVKQRPFEPKKEPKKPSKQPASEDQFSEQPIVQEIAEDVSINPIVPAISHPVADFRPQTIPVEYIAEETPRMVVVRPATSPVTASVTRTAIDEPLAAPAHEIIITKPTDAPNIIPLPTQTQSQTTPAKQRPFEPKKAVKMPINEPEAEPQLFDQPVVQEMAEVLPVKPVTQPTDLPVATFVPQAIPVPTAVAVMPRVDIPQPVTRSITVTTNGLATKTSPVIPLQITSTTQPTKPLQAQPISSQPQQIIVPVNERVMKDQATMAPPQNKASARVVKPAIAPVPTHPTAQTQVPKRQNEPLPLFVKTVTPQQVVAVQARSAEVEERPVVASKPIDRERAIVQLISSLLAKSATTEKRVPVIETIEGEVLSRTESALEPLIDRYAQLVAEAEKGGVATLLKAKARDRQMAVLEELIISLISQPYPTQPSTVPINRPQAPVNRIKAAIKQLVKDNPKPVHASPKASAAYQRQILRLAYKLADIEDLVEKEEYQAAKKELQQVLQVAHASKIKIAYVNLVTGYIYAGILDKALKEEPIRISSTEAVGHPANNRSTSHMKRVVEVLEAEIYSLINKGIQTTGQNESAAEVLLYGYIMKKLDARKSAVSTVIKVIQKDNEGTIWEALVEAIREQPEDVAEFIDHLLLTAKKIAGVIPDPANPILPVKNPYHPEVIQQALASLKTSRKRAITSILDAPVREHEIELDFMSAA